MKTLCFPDLPQRPTLRGTEIISVSCEAVPFAPDYNWGLLIPVQ